MSNTITRDMLAEELAAELSAIRTRLQEKRDAIAADWDEASRAERHAAGSIATACKHLNRAIDELDGLL
ncbi:hypothetical protein L5G28_07685 [Gordonia sp. HY285]|uniref:hypothetical protein n=1 Tax=Gordonia liuliyuniae TaxID=2911517 RepID=UPI001F483CB5|nr:hypothetical protein [Gordonia liuliyuniae]MCF8610042.1 hypothetical protein [Gordonia liuliyuniae]